MRKWPVRFVALLIIVLCQSSCLFIMHTNDAVRDIDNEDYYSAALKLISALEVREQYLRAQDLLADVYPEAVSREERAARLAMNASDQFRWDRVVKHYKRLIRLQDGIKELQPLVHRMREGRIIRFKLKDYRSELRKFSEMAAASHYLQGIRLAESTDNRALLKEAAHEFKKALSFKYSYKDALDMYSKTRKAATVKVLVLTNDYSELQSEIGSLDEILGETLVKEINGIGDGPEFMEVSYMGKWELLYAARDEGGLRYNDTDRLNESDYIELALAAGFDWLFLANLNSHSYSPPREEVIKKSEWKDLAVISNLIKTIQNIADENSNQKIESEIVTADVTIHKISTWLRVRISYELLHGDDSLPPFAGVVVEESSSSVSWATYTGDERALSYESEELSKKSPSAPAGKYEMARRAVRESAGQLGHILFDYDR